MHTRFFRLTAAATASLALLGSCASLSTFAPDLTATAPRLEGYGRSNIMVTSRSPRAIQLFNEAVLQAYAFNDEEAVRTFKAALAQDRQCAMCAWGVAWQLGPIINNHSRDKTAEAVKYVDYALRNLAGATPRERALVESLALRYAHASTVRETAPLTDKICGKKEEGKTHPLDIAYAERMRKLADAYPADADILSLYAEAEMIATEGDDQWDKAGKPAGLIGEVTQRLERLLATQTDHIGLNHYLIHAVDAVSVAPRAVAAADRLGKLAPRSPHLLHMPAHTYVNVGRYADAVRVNDAAVAADVAFTEDLKVQGFSPTADWRGHNLSFMWYAAIMAGNEDGAMATADRLRDRARSDRTFTEFFRTLRLVTLVRMEQWDKVLLEPKPRGEKGMADAWYEHARGVAHARLGQLDEARAALPRLQAGAARIRADNAASDSFEKMLRSIVDVAEFGLQAEIALASRNYDEALAHQAKAVKAAEKLDAREPPVLADGTKLKLGYIQGRAGKWKEAETTYREALADHPASGWALRGLAQALQAQGRQADAEAVRRELARAWQSVPAGLKTVTDARPSQTPPA
ncbi:MAG TPA: hypothetical protein VK996_02045 [Ramlibacter sp.]|nr:hypothetical protein [Ramlibacter sp.]